MASKDLESLRASHDHAQVLSLRLFRFSELSSHRSGHRDDNSTLFVSRLEKCQF